MVVSHSLCSLQDHKRINNHTEETNTLFQSIECYTVTRLNESHDCQERVTNRNSKLSQELKLAHFLVVCLLGDRGLLGDLRVRGHNVIEEGSD